MRYTTTIELPVKQVKQGQYILSKEALSSILAQFATQGNIINVEWKNDNCFVTVEMYTAEKLETVPSSFELFVQDVIRQNSRQN